jgi:hypothetical protein
LQAELRLLRRAWDIVFLANYFRIPIPSGPYGWIAPGDREDKKELFTLHLSGHECAYFPAVFLSLRFHAVNWRIVGRDIARVQVIWERRMNAG